MSVVELLLILIRLRLFDYFHETLRAVRKSEATNF